MEQLHFPDARILILDDEADQVTLISDFLRLGGFNNLATETDPRQAAEAFHNLRPDLVILHLGISPRDGFRMLDRITPLLPTDSYVPVLALTNSTAKETQDRALAAGTTDFLAKPFDAEEILLRTKNLLHTRIVHLKLQEETDRLEGIAAQAEQLARDINTLLTTMCGNAELCQMSLEPEHRGQAHLRRVTEAGSRASHLVQQLSTLARQAYRGRTGPQ